MARRDLSGERRELIAAVKAAVSIEELARLQCGELRRQGAPGRWMARCPFHEDHGPSLSIDGEQGLFHCFGCGAGGDVIRWVELAGDVGFNGAVELLAIRGGVELPSWWARGRP